LAAVERALREILEGVRDGRVPLEEGMRRLRDLAFEDLGFANVDHHRRLRRGFPEVVFAPGKTPEQLRQIVDRMLAGEGPVLVTRVPPEVVPGLLSAHPGGEHDAAARTLLWRRPAPGPKGILVVSAGTSDLPVAQEAVVTAEAFGWSVERLYDVGVAGLHRLLGRGDALRRAQVLVVVAGMDGALPSVVGGLVDAPVIAVPTSTGYGAALGGISALLAMLNSCASGVTVVNVDNGFGAGYAASVAMRAIARAREAAA
jgi:NCAIR mutase (PurE)-related protein